MTRRITECVGPVAPRDIAAAAALGATVARDIAAGDAHPSTPLALIDGWAVHAELTAYAEAYTPAVLTSLREIATGEALDARGDAVAPFEAVTWRGCTGELPTALTPGDGVLLPGTDAGMGEVLWRAGHRLRACDIAAMQALGIPAACVRKPRIRIARAGSGRDDVADAIVGWLAAATKADGGEPVTGSPDAGIAALLAADGADAVAVIGGTGSGARDGSVHALREAGVVEAHGIAVSPGETAAFGMARSRPVLLVPGRLDAAVAVWLLIGRPLLAQLCQGGADTAAPPWQSVLTAKVASTVGLTELVLVRRSGDGVAPLASKYLPLATLAHADGWIIVPAASEGLAPGAPATVRALP